jgi:hypothetical protein
MILFVCLTWAVIFLYNIRSKSMINVVTYMDLKRFDRTDESGAADHVCFSSQGIEGLDCKPIAGYPYH